jgi:predicted ATP-grasp superfamily ATP-dependent carboligase
VLVTDSGYRSGALSAARSLAAHGWTVGLGSALGRKSHAARSRAFSAVHLVPSPELDLAGFVSSVNDAVRRDGYEVVLPTSDLEMLALSERRADVDAVVPYGPPDGVRRALDKLASTLAAEKAGLDVPWTRPADPETLGALADEVEVVVKARNHTFLDRGAGTSFKVATVCRGRREVAARVALIEGEGGEAVVQQPVEGALTALSVVTDESSRPVVSVYQRAIRNWPEPVGGTARGVTERVDPDLARAVASLLAELDWRGLAQLQFVLDAEGRHRFIDFNGRIYGSIALAAAAGVHLPVIWAALATGRAAEPVEAALGARFQWLEGDVKRALLGGAARAVPELVDSLRYARGAAHSVLAPGDVKPALRYARVLAARGLGKLRDRRPNRARRGGGSRSS